MLQSPPQQQPFASLTLVNSSTSPTVFPSGTFLDPTFSVMDFNHQCSGTMTASATTTSQNALPIPKGIFIYGGKGEMGHSVPSHLSSSSSSAGSSIGTLSFPDPYTHTSSHFSPKLSDSTSRYQQIDSPLFSTTNNASERAPSPPSILKMTHCETNPAPGSSFSSSNSSEQGDGTMITSSTVRPWSMNPMTREKKTVSFSDVEDVYLHEEWRRRRKELRRLSIQNKEGLKGVLLRGKQTIKDFLRSGSGSGMNASSFTRMTLSPANSSLAMRIADALELMDGHPDKEDDGIQTQWDHHDECSSSSGNAGRSFRNPFKSLARGDPRSL